MSEFDATNRDHWHEQIVAMVDEGVREHPEGMQHVFLLFSPNAAKDGKHLVINLTIDPETLDDDELYEHVQEVIDDHGATRLTHIGLGSRMVYDREEDIPNKQDWDALDAIMERFGENVVMVYTITSDSVMNSAAPYQVDGNEVEVGEWEHDGWFAREDMVIDRGGTHSLTLFSEGEKE